MKVRFWSEDYFTEDEMVREYEDGTPDEIIEDDCNEFMLNSILDEDTAECGWEIIED